jgi:HPt (histidine-containing phosphotransfer) domain-containing protein
MPSSTPQATPESNEAANEQPIFDRTDALSRIADDEELLDTLIGMFRDDAPGYLAEIESALENGDMAGVVRGAHTLKGVLATFSALRAEARARELEQLAKNGDAAACGALLPSVKAEVETFLQAIA